MKRTLAGFAMLATTLAAALAVAGAASGEVTKTPCRIGTSQGDVYGTAVTNLAPSGAATHVCHAHDTGITASIQPTSCHIGPDDGGVDATRWHLVVTPSGEVVFVCITTPNG